MSAPRWDEAVDLLVFGAGMGGLCAALFGALEGFDVLLCEKTDRIGGTTATSAGTVWIPGAGADGGDAAADLAGAERYLDAEIGNRGDRALREAFLASGREALEHLQRGTAVKFRPAAPHPDYHPALPGWSGKGRAFATVPFDGSVLGADFTLVRPPIAPFMVLGGLMIGRDDIPHFVRPFASLRSFVHVVRILLRHGLDRLRHPRGTRLVMGNALVARLLASLRARKVPLWLNSCLVELIGDGDRVVGAVVETNGTLRRVRARRGVVLATGGFSHNAELCRELLAPPGPSCSVAFAGDSGDGMSAARDLGAAFGEAAGNAAFWMPVSRMTDRAGETLFPHIVLDRAKPGLIAVNAAGRRFVNEADSYHDFVAGMFRSHATVSTIPAYLICDRRFIRDYGIGLVHPGSSARAIARFVAAGYLQQGRDLAELASRLGIDAGRLAQSVADHNRYAASGIDAEFGKGSTALNRHNGDAQNAPNPCLRPIEEAPFFAVAVYPGEFGTSIGLRTDANARVARVDGTSIAGLYACGNDMSSIMAGAYPGPGTTLGPALVFAFRAVRDMVRAQLSS
jgi:succinate dehydrogenase/fumarate reductase flavoprotein subunit